MRALSGKRPSAAGDAAQAEPLASRRASPASTMASPGLAQLARSLNESPRAASLAQRDAQLNAPTAQNRTGMPGSLKAAVERLSGVSLDGVRVHYNSSRPAQLNALAYAQGTDIHLGPGQERHLPHEAWHVVQQAQGRVRPTMQMKQGTPINDDAALEREADQMGARALKTAPAGDISPPAARRPARGGPASVQRQTTAVITMPDPTPAVTIEASATLDTFDDPTTAANAVAIPARPLATPRNTPAYVANIVSTASGKDKTVDQVAEQYAAEAFDTPLDASRRFALVMLANREEKPTDTTTNQDNALDARSTAQAGTVAAFPAAAGRALWRRRWRSGADADHLATQTVAQIRATLDGAADAAAARGLANDAAGAEGLPEGIHNQARNKVRGMAQTGAWVTTFATRGYKPFVHVADADAVTLLATAAPGGGGVAQSLFHRYDALIGANPDAEALTGGYRFAQSPALVANVPPHAAGADRPGQDLMAQTGQAVKTAELDMSIRAALHGVDKTLPYFPEPNLLVRGDLYNRPGVGFGASGREWLKLKTSLFAQGQDLRGGERFTALGGTEHEQRGGGVHCEFPVAARAEMLRLFPTRVAYKTVRQRDRRSREWVSVEDRSRIVVFRSQAQITTALGRAWAASKRFVFDRSAALVTDVGRFDTPYVGTSGAGDGLSGTDYTGGQTDVLALFDPTRALQSHAQWNSIKTTVAFAYGIVQDAQMGWLEDAMRVFLPQQLFEQLAETRATQGTLAVRTNAATVRLAAVRNHLGGFAAFTTAVAAEIADPAQLRAAADARQGPAPNMTAAHKRGAVADRLTARGVHANFIALLDNADRLNIWDAATSADKPGAGVLASVTTALKAVGDAIAVFLQTY